jgi:hypothetical protein
MIYVVSFDPHKTDADKLHQVISNSQNIQNWWHYLGSTYLLKSSYSLTTIKNEILQKWPNQKFLIIKADSSEFSGWLPADAWDWIRSNR